MKLHTRTITRTVVDHIATGADFRRAREAAGITLRALAERAGCSAAYLSDLELGRRKWTKRRLNHFAAHLSASSAPPREPLS